MLCFVLPYLWTWSCGRETRREQNVVEWMVMESVRTDLMTRAVNTSP